MNSRSTKYYESRKAQKGDKKGSVNEGGYNEQQTKTQTKKNPAPSKTQDQPKEDAEASKDDTGGGNDSGKRSDDD
ncbi:MAG: hypothetical protein M3004_13015, partial [Bacteroidota bacterium]|nr:hypothetical protein [Bacteroidota bacterium]